MCALIKCYCGNDDLDAPVLEVGCEKPCPGDNMSKCGGVLSISVYKRTGILRMIERVFRK